MSEERNGAPAGEGDAAPRESGAEHAAASSEERLAAAETELAETKDRLLRALAETENVRRRAQRERDDAARYGAANLARDLVNVADNLGRALASMPNGDSTNELTRTLLLGVEATERELLNAFERHGIRRIDPQGDRFDHNFHEAVLEVDNTGQPPGTVVQVLQPGYVMHDRLLRPAMVAVARGAPPPAAPANEDV